MLGAHSPSDMSYTLVIGLLASLALLILVGPVSSCSDLVHRPARSSSRRRACRCTGMRSCSIPTRSRQIHRAALNSLWVAAWSTGWRRCSADGGSGVSRVSQAVRRACSRRVFMSPLILPASPLAWRR